MAKVPIPSLGKAEQSAIDRIKTAAVAHYNRTFDADEKSDAYKVKRVTWILYKNLVRKEETIQQQITDIDINSDFEE